MGSTSWQRTSYGDGRKIAFKSFDGDYISTYSEGDSCAKLSILDRDGNRVAPRDWWLCRVIGEEFSGDL